MAGAVRFDHGDAELARIDLGKPRDIIGHSAAVRRIRHFGRDIGDDRFEGSHEVLLASPARA